MMSRTLALILAIAIMAGAGCFGDRDEKLLALQQFSASIHEEIGLARADLAMISDPSERARLEKWLNWAESVAGRTDQEIQKAQDLGDAGWGVGEMIVAVVGGFFPPALMALPLIRAFRRNRRNLQSVFKSVDAGGGVKNPDAARTVLGENGGSAYLAFKAWREANGAPPATT